MISSRRRVESHRIMESDIWANLGILLSAVVVTLAGYYGPTLLKKANVQPLPAAPPGTQSAVLAGIGIELGAKDQTERLIAEVKGCRVALEALADRRTQTLEDMQKELLERLDMAEAASKRPPRR